ncbi:MAG: ATPase-like protein [Pseudarthrobacter sp.]|nr:ATPase-like protein [Pseudarthrobacter sp.]
MDAPAVPIRTPDQRIRVFVSSTLRELEPERHAVREAVESLQLAPVMFELGARPHPPRSLYRSYLAQSDVFVGIYGGSYGWVAPGEDVSGLEDEYRLAAGMPKLIYVKDGVADREPRLDGLLDRIRADDDASYKRYADPAELGKLVLADIAVLLAERFDASRQPAEEPPARPVDGGRVPAPFSAIVGRGGAVATVRELLARPDVRLVTMVGPGGIGKSRLAIEVSAGIAGEGADVVFVLLEAVRSADLVLPAIAYGLGVRDAGDGPLEEKIITALAGRRLLMVLDNMEHVLDAAPVVVRLLLALPELTILVTSRAPLRVRFERTYDVTPLEVPAEGADLTPEAAAGIPSVALFVERARAVRPDFGLTPGNSAAVLGICRAVDGVPLALELAAARLRTLAPGTILERLAGGLALLSGGARDLPERQRTLTSTIQWSTDLLPASARAALARLAVFSGPFTLPAAEVLVGDGALDALDLLVESSLLSQRDVGGESVFSLLSTVRSFAASLSTQEEWDAARDAHARYFAGLARAAAQGLRTGEQAAWLATLGLEQADLASAVGWLTRQGQWERAAELAWSLYLYLWLGGLLGQVRLWMARLLEEAEARGESVSGRTEAIALYYTRAIAFWQQQEADLVGGLTRSAELFAQSGDASGEGLARVSVALARLAAPVPDVQGAIGELERSLDRFRAGGNGWGEAMSLVTMGRVLLIAGQGAEAASRFEESLALATREGEALGIAIAVHHRGWVRLFQDNVDGAAEDFARGLQISAGLGHDEGIAYGLEGLVAVAARRGDAARAGELAGSAEALRQRTGLFNAAAASFHGPAVDALRSSALRGAFDDAAARGRALPLAEVLEHAGA